jgi:pimeloyl-ACP methyl ester carboxylesterase
VPIKNIKGLDISYEVIGQGEPWAITPGGRFSKDAAGVREMATDLAREGKEVLIWDRPNTGASENCFEGESESAMQADFLAALLEDLEMKPAVLVGGSGGARVTLLTAARHRGVARALAVWWISGGIYGLMSLGFHYCGNSIETAWTKRMSAVAELPEWQEPFAGRSANRDKLLRQDPKEFIRVLESWMLAYCPREEELIPGRPDSVTRYMSLPSLVFRSGESDPHHTRLTSERLAGMLPEATLVEPPWGDREWIERVEHAAQGGLFAGWPLLVPQLLEWSSTL